MQFFLSVPTEQKFEKGLGRLLHRRSIEHVVPSKVVWKPHKDMGINQSLAMRGILKSPLKYIGDDLHELLVEIIEIGKYERLKNLSINYDVSDTSNLANYKNIIRILWLHNWLSNFTSVRAI